jgi:hypothetical protein
MTAPSEKIRSVPWFVPSRSTASARPRCDSETHASRRCSPYDHLQPARRGFTNAEMRALLAQMLGLDPANYPAGRMTYDLRRLRLHGHHRAHSAQPPLSAHCPGSSVALFFSRTYTRLLRAVLAELMPGTPPTDAPIRFAFDRLQSAIDTVCEEQKLVT